MRVGLLVFADRSAVLPRMSPRQLKSAGGVDDERLVDRPVRAVVFQRSSGRGQQQADVNAAPGSERNGLHRGPRSDDPGSRASWLLVMPLTCGVGAVSRDLRGSRRLAAAGGRQHQQARW